MNDDITKINLLLSSKKMRETNQNPNNIILNIDQLIQCDPKTQYIEMNIVSWIMKNDFYNTQSANNKFNILYKDLDDNLLTSVNYEITAGNYTVYQMRDKLNELLAGIITVSYEETLNKYKFVRTYVNETEKIYINVISANDFIGYDNNTEILIDIDGINSVNVLNMAGDSAILLEIPNISTKPKLLDNILNGIVKPSSIVAYIVIDVPSYGLLKYENHDGGDSFSYVLEEKEIQSLHLMVKNQDKEVIEVSDYDLTLQFIIHNKNTSNMVVLLQSIDKSLKTILQMVGDIWRKFTKK